MKKVREGREGEGEREGEGGRERGGEREFSRVREDALSSSVVRC